MDRPQQRQHAGVLAASTAGGKASATARLGGSIVSAFCEIGLFHPVDTVREQAALPLPVPCPRAGSGTPLAALAGLATTHSGTVYTSRFVRRVATVLCCRYQ